MRLWRVLRAWKQERALSSFIKLLSRGQTSSPSCQLAADGFHGSFLRGGGIAAGNQCKSPLKSFHLFWIIWRNQNYTFDLNSSFTIKCREEPPFWFRDERVHFYRVFQCWVNAGAFLLFPAPPSSYTVLLQKCISKFELHEKQFKFAR